MRPSLVMPFEGLLGSQSDRRGGGVVQRSCRRALQRVRRLDPGEFTERTALRCAPVDLAEQSSEWVFNPGLCRIKGLIFWSIRFMVLTALARHNLTDLPNISFALGEELKQVGIGRPADLVQVGAEEAWSRVRAIGRHDNIQTLLALEGAVQSVDWRDLPHDRRAVLLRFATHAASIARAA